jgi:hypothetical protein
MLNDKDTRALPMAPAPRLPNAVRQAQAPVPHVPPPAVMPQGVYVKPHYRDEPEQEPIPAHREAGRAAARTSGKSAHAPAHHAHKKPAAEPAAPAANPQNPPDLLSIINKD